VWLETGFGCLPRLAAVVSTRVNGVVRVSFLGRIGTVDAVRDRCDSHGIGFQIFARRLASGRRI